MTAALIGMVIGLVLGLTGAGGSVLALPLLMTGLAVTPATAAGLSLGTVMLAAMFGVTLRLGRGQIAWRAAVMLGLSGALFTPLGQWLAQKMPVIWLMTAFTFLVVVIARRMWQQARISPADTLVVRAGSRAEMAGFSSACSLSSSGNLEWRWPCISQMVLVGALTGVLSGLFGVGGGFVIVPALVLLTGVSMLQAVATSLVIISMVSFAGFTSFVLQQKPVLTMWWPLAAGAITGMILGTVLAPRVAGPRLQRFFVILMVSLAGWMLYQQLSH